MKVDLSSIRETGGAAVQFQGVQELASEPQLGLNYTGPLEITGSITNTGNGFLVTANLKYSYNGNCSRCLDSVQGTQEVTLAEEFEPENNDSLLTIKGDKLDLTDYLAEQVLLNLPMKLICKPECRGFCAECGVNLNQTSCECIKENFNPELLKLKTLLSLEGGGSNGESNQ